MTKEKLVITEYYDPDLFPLDEIAEEALEVYGAIAIEKDQEYAYQIDGLQNYIHALKEKLKFLKEDQESNRARLLSRMDYMGIKKIQSPLVTLSIAQSPGAVEIIDLELLKANHAEYFIAQEPKLDKAKLLEDLRDGLYIEGAILKKESVLKVKK